MIQPSFVPRYHEIEQALRTRVASRQPGEALPSDTMLCQEFGVSRMTARHAMQQLAQEGLVYRVPGRGTFVAEPPTHRRANSLLSFSNETRRRGRVPSSRVLSRTLRRPTREEATRLRLKEGERVVSVRRLRLADGEPIAVESAILHGRCARVVMAADLESQSLHTALSKAGFLPSRGRATVRAEAAKGEDLRLLRLTRGDALLVEQRIILDQRGQPLEFTESRYAGGRYALDVDFEVEDTARRRR